MEENKLKTIEGELEAPADFTSPDSFVPGSCCEYQKVPSVR